MARTWIALLGVIGLLSGSAFAEPAFQPAKTKSGYFRTSDGVRLHYLEAGKGRPIVFVPGWTVPAWMWDPQIRHLAKEYRVLALDPRSQGKSERSNEGNYLERRSRDIKEFVDKLNLAPVVLVGHSLAVTELLSYVQQFGTSTVAGLVLVDDDFGPFPKPEESAQILGLLRQLSLNRKEVVAQMAAAGCKKPPPPGYMERILDDVMKTPTNTAIALLAGSTGIDFKPTLATVTVPVLYAITPKFREEGEWLKRNVPTAKVEIFEDAGHVLFMDEPERFNSLLERFARGAFERRQLSPG